MLRGVLFSLDFNSCSGTTRFRMKDKGLPILRGRAFNPGANWIWLRAQLSPNRESVQENLRTSAPISVMTVTGNMVEGLVNFRLRGLFPMGAFGLCADSELRSTLCNYASEVVIRKAPNCVFRQGQKPHGFYLINRGSVKLSMESPTGRKVLERVVGQGCVVGLPATANGHPYSLTCEVVEDTEFSYLSRRDFSNLMKCESEAAMKLLGLLSNEVQAARLEIARSPKASAAAISMLTN